MEVENKLKNKEELYANLVKLQVLLLKCKMIINRHISILGKMGNFGSGLSMADELVLVLTKLSCAVTNKDLGYKFDADKTKVTKFFIDGLMLRFRI